VPAPFHLGDSVRRRVGPLRALLFDFDGTLWDPETQIFQVYAEVYRRHGHVLTLSKWCGLVGTIGFDLWAELELLTGVRLDREALQAEVVRRRTQMLDSLGARPGTRRFLAEADLAGLRRSLVSNSSTQWVDRYGRQCGLTGGWSGVHCANGEATRAKPRPDLYQEALRRLEVRPGEALAFEDSPAGIEAARSAGVRCVVVPNSVTALLDLSRADLRVGSFRNLGLRTLLQVFEADVH
jgi:beta-phosphoglucomutase-like phosphatase (HAD superfamily)